MYAKFKMKYLNIVEHTLHQKVSAIIVAINKQWEQEHRYQRNRFCTIKSVQSLLPDAAWGQESQLPCPPFVSLAGAAIIQIRLYIQHLYVPAGMAC